MTHLSAFSSSLIALRLIVFTDFNKVFKVCGFDCYSVSIYSSFQDGDLCYVFFKKELNMAQAQSYCLHFGFHLPRVATIQSFSEAMRARHFASETGNATVWLGIRYHVSRRHHWWEENNEPVNFTSLNAERLANKDVGPCKAINLSNLTISNVYCTDGLYVLCMKSQLHWFGPNKMHLCHCRSGGCDERGACHEADGRCAIGWFGEGCQYGDLLINTFNNLTDFDDTTCKIISSQCMLSFQSQHYISWIRVVSKHPVNKDMFSVVVDAWNGTIECRGKKAFIINNYTVDIWCSDHVIQARALLLKFTGLKTLCSVHIFRGQNVALKQNAALSSTLGSRNASNAVDGEYGLITPSAMTTLSDGKQTWTLELEPRAIIFEVLVHLKYPVCQSMTGVNLKLEILSHSTFPSTYLPFIFDGRRNYISILPRTKEPAKYVIIGMDKTGADNKSLDLSEVSVFGACVPPFYGPYCNRFCSAACASQLCHVTGECLQPPIGGKTSMVTSKATKILSSDITTRKSSTATFKENRTLTTASMETNMLCTTAGTNTTTTQSTPKKSTPVKLSESDCPEGYSGRKCMYLCHCKNRLCDKWGRCRDGSTCADGWFALQCQYKNLAVNGRTSDPALNDGDDSTCFIPPENVATAEVDEPFLFTWIRIVFGPEAQVLNFSLSFHQPETCRSIRVVSDVRNQFDVFCHNEVVTRRIELRWQGAGPVCSLYVNGGRNMATDGHFRMSDDKEIYHFNFLRDGNVTNVQGVDLNADLNNNLTLKFSYKINVYRVVIFTDAGNRTDSNFSLNGTLQDGTVLFQYISPTSGERHVVFSSETKVLSLQEITFLSVNGSLRISEILVFGDCAPPLFFLGCTEICILTCSRNRCNYNGFCYECPLGSRGDHCMEVFGETDNASTPLYDIPQKKINEKKRNLDKYLVLFIPFIVILVTICYKLRERKSRQEDISKKSVTEHSKDTKKIAAGSTFDRNSDYFVTEGSSVDIESQCTSENSKYSIGIHPGGGKQHFAERRNGTKMKEMKDIPRSKRLLNKSKYYVSDGSSVDAGTAYTFESSSYSIEAKTDSETTESTSTSFS